MSAPGTAHKGACLACGGTVVRVADLGDQPLTNRFPRAPGAEPYRYRLTVVVCERCGLVQLSAPPPAPELTPRVDWVAHREPEVHLAALAERLAALEGFQTNARVLGLGEHDRPVLERLAASGLEVTVLDWRQELGTARPHAGTETLQELLTRQAARRLIAHHGRADLLVARSLIEHAHHLTGLLEALAELVAPGGYLLIETPDSEPALERSEASILWEEHATYFTEATLKETVARASFETVWVWRPEGTTELDLLARRSEAARPGSTLGADLNDELERAMRFGASLAPAGRRWRQLLDQERRDGHTGALFGAGHAGIVFVNVFGLGGRLSWAIDDHPMKQGLLLPGSEIPIAPAAKLDDSGIDVCLMALSPESEERVLETHRSWRERGGRFVSILPSSRLYPLREAGR